MWPCTRSTKKQDIERVKRLNEFSGPKVEKILVEAGSAPRGLTVDRAARQMNNKVSSVHSTGSDIDASWGVQILKYVVFVPEREPSPNPPAAPLGTGRWAWQSSSMVAIVIMHPSLALSKISWFRITAVGTGNCKLGYSTKQQSRLLASQKNRTFPCHKEGHKIYEREKNQKKF